MAERSCAALGVERTGLVADIDAVHTPHKQLQVSRIHDSRSLGLVPRWRARIAAVRQSRQAVMNDEILRAKVAAFFERCFIVHATVQKSYPTQEAAELAVNELCELAGVKHEKMQRYTLDGSKRVLT